MREVVLKSIRQRFSAFLDLAESIDKSLLNKQLAVAKSKSIGEHLWCVIGARESYARSLQVGDWDGFSCSLASTDDLDVIIEKLKSSEAAFNQSVDKVEQWTPERDDLLVHLLEHETMHEGQLIRHMYALEQALPPTIKWG